MTVAQCANQIVLDYNLTPRHVDKISAWLHSSYYILIYQVFRFCGIWDGDNNVISISKSILQSIYSEVGIQINNTYLV